MCDVDRASTKSGLGNFKQDRLNRLNTGESRPA